MIWIRNMDFINTYLNLENILIIIILLSIIGIIKVLRVRILLSYILSISISLFIGEKLLKEDANSKILLGDYSSGKYFSKNSNYVGYGPKSDGIFSSIKIDKPTKDTVYNVKYTIENLYRKTPNSNSNSNNNKTKVFLGCSFTFGEGLNDYETFPFYINEMYNKNFRILNYGFHGYGPHNIHSQVKNIILKEEKILDHIDSTHFYYKFYWWHIPRAIPDSSKKGPKYEIINDSLVYKGQMSNESFTKSLFMAFYRRVVHRSNIYSKFFSPVGYKEIDEINLYDVNRTLYLIKDIDRNIKLKKGAFTLVIDYESFNSKKIKGFLDINKIDYLCLECEVESLNEHRKLIIRGDGHPSRFANKIESEIFYNKTKN